MKNKSKTGKKRYKIIKRKNIKLFVPAINKV